MVASLVMQQEGKMKDPSFCPNYQNIWNQCGEAILNHLWTAQMTFVYPSNSLAFSYRVKYGWHWCPPHQYNWSRTTWLVYDSNSSTTKSTYLLQGSINRNKGLICAQNSNLLHIKLEQLIKSRPYKNKKFVDNIFQLEKETQQRRQIIPPQVWMVPVKTVQAKIILVRKGSQAD